MENAIPDNVVGSAAGTAQEFDLGDVLSITTGRLLSPSGIGGVYQILNFMTGDNLFTHQLPRVSDECRPHLLRQFPALADVTGDDVELDGWEAWMAGLVAVHGAKLMVEPLPAGEHAKIDPLTELMDLTDPSKIVAVVTP